MKVLLAILLILSFTSAAVFGVFLMNHKADHNYKGCVAATVQGTDCPKEKNNISFLNFHLDAFRNFSALIFNGNVASMLSLLVALALIAYFGVVKSSSAWLVLAASYYLKHFSESNSFSFQPELIHWLALQENSPANL